ncbi:hypothetical protein LZ575_07035 [Antarcticibacterium sp. 1MA-6-2]|uniref:TlpA family protein disulfide reductase n=1 Tax=Antarcticibacterium sp. 1MA-6-2 TaxID=2908210 RepID=UPI001F23D75A|nr:hypothetical protein [Antarcticibacterium sp. 1MA-6-2]UJH92289.1 hypothetical protein LZ575_07035 [Antarcticibacterium sp. 1MA-6-2]
MKLRSLLVFLLLMMCFSCNKEKSSANDVYFGGLIVNPTSKYVVLLKKDVVVDTFFLNSKNQFGGKLIGVEKGLYVFKHPPEHQILYLEPGDSTLVLLNTLDFDESLNFSGKGAEKSNYLNRMYLLNQENNNLILSCFKLGAEEFSKKTDSIRSLRKEHLDKLHKKYKFSNEFFDLAEASIDYEFYDLRERYAFLIRKYSGKDAIKNIPSDFHEYRKEISFNDEKLEDYYVYLNFLDDFLRIKSLEYCEDALPGTDCADFEKFENLERRIVLADSLILNERIKNNFIDRFAAQGIIYSQSTEDLIAILKLLDKVNYTGDRRTDLRQMAGIQNSLLPGNNIGELKLLNFQKDTILLNDISSKPKITFHWTVNSQSHYKWQHKRIEELKKRFPEVEFVGINIDKNHFEEWHNIIADQGYNEINEYKLNVLSLNEDLLKIYLYKSIFLDQSGKIIKGDAQINSPDFEDNIEEFLDELFPYKKA